MSFLSGVGFWSLGRGPGWVWKWPHDGVSCVWLQNCCFGVGANSRANTHTDGQTEDREHSYFWCKNQYKNHCVDLQFRCLDPYVGSQNRLAWLVCVCWLWFRSVAPWCCLHCVRIMPPHVRVSFALFRCVIRHASEHFPQNQQPSNPTVVTLQMCKSMKDTFERSTRHWSTRALHNAPRMPAHGIGNSNKHAPTWSRAPGHTRRNAATRRASASNLQTTGVST